MEVIKPGKEVPKSFVAVCKKLGPRGCGAEMVVTPEDCFKADCGPGWYLSFFCGHCGLVITPDHDYADRKDWKGIEDKAELMGLEFKTEDNVPPWSSQGFLSIDAYCKKHGIKYGFR